VVAVLLLLCLIGNDAFFDDEHGLETDFEAIANKHERNGVILAVASSADRLRHCL
jgi:hypothetical protein